MSLAEREPEIPTWLAGVVVALFAVTLLYGIFVRASIMAAIMGWLWLVSIGLSLFVVYLFYRFVLAVEKIATKL